jgi:hypothetical protein
VDSMEKIITIYLCTIVCMEDFSKRLFVIKECYCNVSSVCMMTALLSTFMRSVYNTFLAFPNNNLHSPLLGNARYI